MENQHVTTLDLETEMNNDVGFIKDLMNLLIQSSYAGGINGLPEYIVVESIDKIDELDECVQLAIKRLMAYEEGEQSDRQNG